LLDAHESPAHFAFTGQLVGGATDGGRAAVQGGDVGVFGPRGIVMAGNAGEADEVMEVGLAGTAGLSLSHSDLQVDGGVISGIAELNS